MQRRSLAIIYLTIFIDLLCVGMVIPVLPGLIVTDLEKPEYMVGIVACIVPFTQFLFAPIWGSKSDEIGRKPIMLLSISVNFFACLMFANSENLIMLVLSRILSGIGSANFATAQAYVSDISPPEIRTKNIGIISSAFGLGFVLGPGLGGILKTRGGIESIGFVTALLCLINLYTVWKYMPETNKSSVLKSRNSFREIIREIKVSLSDKSMRILFLIHSLFIASFGMMQISSPLLWKQKYDLNDDQIGYMFSFIGLCSIVVQGTLVGRFTIVLGEKLMMIAGCVLMMIGLIIFPNVTVNSFMPMGLILVLVISIANGLIIPAANTLVSRKAGKDKQGAVLGSLQSFSSLSRTAGPLLSGYLFMMFYPLPFYTGAGIMFFCLIMALVYFKRGSETL